MNMEMNIVARELSKVFEYSDWNKSLHVLNKTKEGCQKEIIMILIIYKIINYQEIYVI